MVIRIASHHASYMLHEIVKRVAHRPRSRNAWGKENNQRVAESDQYRI
jgi:hypothetical protein